MNERYFVDGAGYVWREDPGDGGGISMARVNPDNSQIPGPRTYLLPVSDDEGLERVLRAVEFTQAGHEQGVADERARCVADLNAALLADPRGLHMGIRRALYFVRNPYASPNATPPVAPSPVGGEQ